MNTDKNQCPGPGWIWSDDATPPRWLPPEVPLCPYCKSNANAYCGKMRFRFVCGTEMFLDDRTIHQSNVCRITRALSEADKTIAELKAELKQKQFQ